MRTGPRRRHPARPYRIRRHRRLAHLQPRHRNRRRNADRESSRHVDVGVRRRLARLVHEVAGRAREGRHHSESARLQAERRFSLSGGVRADHLDFDRAGRRRRHPNIGVEVSRQTRQNARVRRLLDVRQSGAELRETNCQLAVALGDNYVAAASVLRRRHAQRSPRTAATRRCRHSGRAFPLRQGHRGDVVHVSGVDRLQIVPRHLLHGLRRHS